MSDNTENTVWKYPLALGVTPNIVDIPQHAEFLHVDYFNNQVCLWFEVDPTEEKEARRFHILGTGHPMPSKGYLNHLGSCIDRSHGLVWHVYEED